MFNLKSWAVVPVFAASLLIGSCGSDEPDDPAKKPDQKPVSITVEPAKAVTVNFESQSVNVTVTSTADWSIASDADWCKVFPTGGVRNEPTTVKITVSGYSGDLESRVASLTVSAGSNASETITVTQTPVSIVRPSTLSMAFGGQAGSQKFTIEANVDWELSPRADWIAVTPLKGGAGVHEITVTVAENMTAADRKGEIYLTDDSGTRTIEVRQMSDAITTPEGYTLVWHDEFNDPTVKRPDTREWWYEVWNPGTVNNELQRYIAGERDGVTTAEIADGFLNIYAKKVGNEVWSARINTSNYWTYGYFEARLKLPKGKGTWPAFWMMPQTGGNNWPSCGEIDIMEEVGVNPNYTSSSIHCKAYNHMIGTQKTKEVFTPGAEDEFHVYALEWTPDYIRTYVDGKKLLDFPNDHAGNPDTWPFDKAFGLKLNLAWGGDWGGYAGVDEKALPATYQIDYVRVFQKQ